MTGWTYGLCGTTEFASVRDDVLPDLRPHFHLEDQLVLLLDGRRDFTTPGGTITARAGQAVYFPALNIHAALATTAPVTCINYYFPARDRPGAAQLIDIGGEISSFAASPHSAEQLMACIDSPVDQAVQAHASLAARRLLGAGNIAVGEAAQRLGLSREGFSRRFSRDTGLAPLGYRNLSRLNTARSLLKRGDRLVDAAMAAGFSDQSHMSRQFRATFGVTPGAYRNALNSRNR